MADDFIGYVLLQVSYLRFGLGRAGFLMAFDFFRYVLSQDS